MLLQAQAARMAQVYGKHRQRYERRTTPPGFWRVGFPSTQEVEIDRERAERMEREQVEERRKEAMREGGRWVFRDEIHTARDRGL